MHTRGTVCTLHSTMYIPQYMIFPPRLSTKGRPQQALVPLGIGGQARGYAKPVPFSKGAAWPPVRQATHSMYIVPRHRYSAIICTFVFSISIHIKGVLNRVTRASRRPFSIENSLCSRLALQSWPQIGSFWLENTLPQAVFTPSLRSKKPIIRIASENYIL